MKTAFAAISFKKSKLAYKSTLLSFLFSFLFQYSYIIPFYEEKDSKQGLWVYMTERSARINNAAGAG